MNFHLQAKNPSKEQYYRGRGKCYWEMENPDLAISDFHEAVRKDPRKTNLALLVDALFSVGRYDELIGKSRNNSIWPR